MPAFQGLAAPQFRPGQEWLDTLEKPIQAHGGGLLVLGNTYYWFGEDRTTPKTSVSCYSSTNLYDWTHEGVVFTLEQFPEQYRAASFIERPKVIFNERTRTYILWFHMEQRGYHFARAGIATSDKVSGPFTFKHAIRPIQHDAGYPANQPDQQKEFGGTYRDMNLFVDDDGKAYAIYASEGNWTMYIVRLNSDFTGPETPPLEGKTWARVLVRQMREAPAPFKFNDRYYMVTSGCTGWKPNKAEYAVADNILGPWTTKANPCAGPDAELTFGAQSTHVIPLDPANGSFIFMADRWNPRNLKDSRYVWLPLFAHPDGTISIPWHDTWDLSVFSAK
jgi:hypothetical protein